MSRDRSYQSRTFATSGIYTQLGFRHPTQLQAINIEATVISPYGSWRRNPQQSTSIQNIL